MADTPKWFDYEFYMSAKLAQLQAAEPANDWTVAKLVDAFAQNGFMGEEGAYVHFVQYGAAEEVAPNADFNASEYYAAKAAQFYGVEPSAVTELQIANVKALINEAGMNAWTHYVQYGSNEGVNPSNAFDADAYLAAKAAAMGGDWTADSIAKAISDAGMTVLEHYLTYGGKGEGEVAEGATFPVADDQKVPSNNPGETFTLTTGVDTFVGGAGDDVFNATVTATSPVLGALDSIDGGAGNDTLNVADTAVSADVQFSFPNGFTVKGVENINITTNGGINVDLSENADVTSIKGIAAGTANSEVTASDSADVDLTVAGAATATVAGGKAVSVTGGTGATSISGKGLTTVIVKGGGQVTIDNTENSVSATTAKGTTLTSVVLDGVDANSAIKGEGLTDVTVKGATAAARTVSITNAKADHALTVNVDGTGYSVNGTEVQTIVADANATAITVNASGDDSSLALTGSDKVKALNITGDAALTLKASDLAALTTIDGSTATGDLTLGELNAKTVAVKTGAGDDAFTIKATTKVTVDAGAGAGDDVVTLGAVIAAGSTINLGAGDDALLADSGSVAASTKDATTVIDGGDGFDTVSATLINAANAAQFHNFEALDLSANVTNLDVALMTNSTLEALTLSGGSGIAAVSNVAAGVELLVSGENTGATTINVKDAATGTADAFSVAFNGTAAATATEVAPTASSATVVVNGIENLSVESTGTGFVANTLKVTDNALQTLTITGDKELSLSFTGTNGTNGAAGGAVKLIDGSAATGDLTIDTTNVTADSKVGLTVNTGSGDDAITLAQKATVDAGAGDDTITASAFGGTFTGGAGEDTFNVSAAVLQNVSSIDTMVISTITDFGADDTLTMIGAATAITELKLDATVQNLLGALTLAAKTADTTVWFQYAGDTYIVANDGTGGLGTGDLAVKLTGTGYDFDGATLNAGELSLA